MNDVTNTSAKDQIETNFAVAALGGIEWQEAQGQRELVNSEVLPTEIGYHESLLTYERLGFSFGDEVDGDPLFRHATLPDGWSRKASDHSMWSGIVDERGIERVGIFYKAAFYDRRASMQIANVGNALANKVLYGEMPDLDWSLLTRDEWESFRDGVTQMRGNIERHPDIYGDHAEQCDEADRLADRFIRDAEGDQR